MLTHVSGLTTTLAENIIAYRDDIGRFKARTELKKVPRLGPKAFEQCAGFLRIMDGSNALDASAVHPEAYPVVKKIAADTGRDIRKLIGNTVELNKLDPKRYTDEQFGLPTVQDILKELDKPGRDPRPEFKTATFKEGVEKISDLKEDMVLEGVISNVTHFGAFVDIGVHQDGLVHISALADKFVKDPHDVVSTGDVVKVKVMEVDAKRKRIALTMKLSDKAEPDRGAADRNNKSQTDTKPETAGKPSAQNKAQKHTRKAPENNLGSLGAALLQAKQKAKK